MNNEIKPIKKTKINFKIVIMIIVITILLICSIVLIMQIIKKNRVDDDIIFDISAKERYYLYEKDEIELKLLQNDKQLPLTYEAEVDESNIYAISSKEISSKVKAVEIDPFEVGKATLKLTAKYKEQIIERTIDILICKPLSENIKVSELEFEEGSTIDLNLDLGVADCNEVNLSTTDDGFIEKTSSGSYIAKKTGTTTLIIDDSKQKVEVKLNIIKDQNIKPTKIEFDKQQLNVEINTKQTLNLVATPKEASLRNIIYESSDEKVVEVTQDGTITAKALGTATITAKTIDNRLSATIDIIVISNIEKDPPKAKNITIESNNLYNKNYATLKNQLTLTMEFTQDVTTPTVTIGGSKATVIKQDDKYLAFIEVSKNMKEGPITFEISNYQNKAGIKGNKITNVTAGSKVIIDTVKPVCILTQLENKLLVQAADTSEIYGYIINDMPTSESGFIKNDTITITSSGTYYGHVMDQAGNIGDCHLDVTIE